MNTDYLSAPQPIRYDGESDDPPAPTPKTFSQADVDRIMITHRRAMQAKIVDLEGQLSAAAVERGKLQSHADELTDTHHRALSERESQLAVEWSGKLSERDALHTATLAELQTKHTAVETRLNDITSKYHSHRITHELLAEASQSDAVVPRQIAALLERHAKVIDDRVMIQIGDRQLAPNEVIAEMREDVEQYGNLFKSRIVGGIGGDSGSKLSRKSPDVRHMSPEQYRQLKQTNPSVLGLRGGR